MQARFFQRYVWLVNTISGAGHISLEEINRRWANSSVNDYHESEYNRRTFIRHKEDIAEIFGIEIGYNRSSNTYFIANQEDIKRGDLRQWLMNNLAINNAITESQTLRNRIQVEQIPAGTQYLPTIVSAMRDNRILQLTHHKFDNAPQTFTLKPYCLKVFKQRWYIYGCPSTHPTERRIYALDRISALQELDSTFTMPENFDADTEFAAYYGVFTNEDPQTVRVRVVSKGTHFMRTLPLHHSQREVLTTDDYSEFEFWIAPTFDFIQQLLTYGSQLEVLTPNWLREKMEKEVHAMLNLYE